MSDLQFQVTAQFTDAYASYSAPIMSPFVDALAESVESGDRILDLACGTGFVSNACLQRVGATGTITGVDVNRPMLEAARRHLGTTVRLVQAAAGDLPFGEDAFDKVLCQQGLQFFPDPEAALREVRHVLRPGGLFAATCWMARDQSAYLDAQGHAVEAVTGVDHSGSAAFSMTPEIFHDAARRAGLENVVVRERRVTVHLPTLTWFLPGHLSALPFGARIATENPAAVPAIVTSIRDRLRPYGTDDGGADVPFAAYLLTARKPRAQRA